MSGEWLLWAAVLLVCPLMMIWMMRGGGVGHGDDSTPPENGAEGSDGSSSSTDETAELKQRIADLEAERDREREEAGG